MQPLSQISRDAFLKLNEFAKSESPASILNLDCALTELNKTTETGMLAGMAALGQSNIVVLSDATIASLRSFAELETIYEFPAELQHPVEQVTVCLVLMRRIEVDATDGSDIIDRPKFTHNEIQRRLSRLRIEYPLMMDPRVLIGVRTRELEYSTVACAIAETSFGALPCEAHGLSKRDLRVFVGKPSVRNGIGTASPMTSVAMSSVRGRSPIQVAFNNTVAPAVANATRGAFLASLLELSHLAETLDPLRSW